MKQTNNQYQNIPGKATTMPGRGKILFWIAILSVIFLFSGSSLLAQSGSWNGWKIQGAGYQDHGNGVIQLLDSIADGCEGAAVHSGTQYLPCSGNFNQCYQVLFGCNENGGDGLAFTFTNCPAADWQVWGCGGGLGYHHGCHTNRGVTIEFDTFDNEGAMDFDAIYEGGGGGNQIAIHRDLEARTMGYVTSEGVPNLADGQEHTVCIQYDNTSHVLSVTIDGATVISHNLSLNGLDFQSYFGGCGGLYQVWSAGTNVATNQMAVSDGPSIAAQAGPLCPGMLPVEFLSVSAQGMASSVEVLWSTASEVHNNRFIIERSANLIDWEPIGEVPGAGTSSSVLHYSFTDFNYLDGVSYYRIRQVDYDGSFAFSRVVSVKMAKTSIVVMPNPFEEVLTIQSNSEEDINVEIMDVLGRVLFATKLEVGGTGQIQPDLIPGAYFLLMEGESFREQRKIVKK